MRPTHPFGVILYQRFRGGQFFFFFFREVGCEYHGIEVGWTGTCAVDWFGTALLLSFHWFYEQLSKIADCPDGLETPGTVPADAACFLSATPTPQDSYYPPSDLFTPPQSTPLLINVVWKRK